MPLTGRELPCCASHPGPRAPRGEWRPYSIFSVVEELRRVQPEIYGYQTFVRCNDCVRRLLLSHHQRQGCNPQAPPQPPVLFLLLLKRASYIQHGRIRWCASHMKRDRNDALFVFRTEYWRQVNTKGAFRQRNQDTCNNNAAAVGNTELVIVLEDILSFISIFIISMNVNRCKERTN